jgi:BirA family biotin operon repressor/biotin-[acetyl-CoA-carboxylase] ligase
MVRVKWPNDIMLLGLGARAASNAAAKTAGILAESVTDASGCAVCIGVGVNLAQTEFPAAFRGKATSLLLAQRALSGASPSAGDGRFPLLEKILARLYPEITGDQTRSFWRERLEARLYRRGERVRFSEGAADTGRCIEGVLSGIGEGGELLITPDGETKARAFTTGELDVYPG